MDDDLGSDDAGLVLQDLRRARRRRRTEDFDPFDALYKVYITAVLLGVAVWLLSGVTGDTRVDAATVHRVVEHGPQIVGAVIGVSLGIGLRSGGRGGPLVIEAADVRHVLLSPLDRTVALRPVAVRQMRFGLVVGAGAGGLAGLLAYRRLPGGFVGWVASGAAVGLLTATAALGLAMVVAGRRYGRWVGSGLALAVAAWSAADLAEKTTTSPATLLGDVALWPLEFRLIGVIGIAATLACVSVGLGTVAGSSIEAAESRSTLVGQIRFAATLRDLRTVVVLRRQLSQELPRQRPWFRMPRSVAPGGRSRRRALPVWRRGWHGILRFPALRFARLAVLGAIAGAATVGVWRGTTPLVLVAGAALYVAGLDAVEPLAQEIDHPDRRDEYSVAAGVLALRQLGPSVVLMILVSLIGYVVAVAATGGDANAVQLGAVLVLPAALAATAAATISVVQGAPSTFSSTDVMLPPEAAGARAIGRIIIPPVVATAGIAPILSGRSPAAHVSPLQSVIGLEPPLLILVVLVGVWLRYRDNIRATFASALQEAGSKGQARST
ncbi:MAG: hypothetical protein M3063_05565 [Actinomycetota bacterium]|nr:hypothetical protein [Actinomycetota bacterium]